MIRITEIKLPLSALPVVNRLPVDALQPTDAEASDLARLHPLDALRQQVVQTLSILEQDIASINVYKRSFDARKQTLLAVFIVDVTLHDAQQAAHLLEQFAKHPRVQPTPNMHWVPPVRWSGADPSSPRPVVVGLGPCGLFAALALAQMGLKPLVLERGRDVRQRTKDTWGLWRKQQLQPESNVQFGEGGAGLFSDGKLYSQIKDPRHLGRKVIQEFVDAGAPADILYAAHPHVGTFKLVKVVERLRATIESLGGEIRFEHKVLNLELDESNPAKRVVGLYVENLRTAAKEFISTQHVVVALGHSARDTFARLFDQGVHMVAKPFSVGVRIEHPQSVIDQARWGRHANHPLLGAADYKLVHHAQNGRAVYSFCMCPGGTVVAATSEPDRVVTNGMSQYSRSERNANAGLVVGIEPQDYQFEPHDWQAAFGQEQGLVYAAQAQHMQAQQQTHPLAGIVLQRSLERRAFEVGGQNYHAPVQRVQDFLAGQPSVALGAVLPSYQPGVKPCDLAQVLPNFVVQAMREALPVFGRKIKGFDMPDAVLTGVETRTSSPLRMERGGDYQSLNTAGLYPAGEGAGYAGGILSAAVDGIKVAEALAQDWAK